MIYDTLDDQLEVPPVDPLQTRSIADSSKKTDAIDIGPQIVPGTFDPMLLVFFGPVFIAAALHRSATR